MPDSGRAITTAAREAYAAFADATKYTLGGLPPWHLIGPSQEDWIAVAEAVVREEHDRLRSPAIRRMIALIIEDAHDEIDRMPSGFRGARADQHLVCERHAERVLALFGESTQEQAAPPVEQPIHPSLLAAGNVISLRVFSPQEGWERELRTVVGIVQNGVRLREGDREYDWDWTTDDLVKRDLRLVSQEQAGCPRCGSGRRVGSADSPDGPKRWQCVPCGQVYGSQEQAGE